MLKCQIQRSIVILCFWSFFFFPLLNCRRTYTLFQGLLILCTYVYISSMMSEKYWERKKEFFWIFTIKMHSGMCSFFGIYDIIFRLYLRQRFRHSVKQLADTFGHFQQFQDYKDGRTDDRWVRRKPRHDGKRKHRQTMQKSTRLHTIDYYKLWLHYDIDTITDMMLT